MVITNCAFTNFNSTGIEISTSGRDLNIINSNFTNGGNDIDLLEGGAFKLSKVKYFNATGNRFSNLTAAQGAGMYFDILEIWPYTISNNVFINCTAA